MSDPVTFSLAPARAFVDALHSSKDVTGLSSACLSAVRQASPLAHAHLRHMGAEAKAAAERAGGTTASMASCSPSMSARAEGASHLLDRSASCVRAFAASKTARHNSSTSREALFGRKSSFRSFAEAANPSNLDARRQQQQQQQRPHTAASPTPSDRCGTSAKIAVLRAYDEAAREYAEALGVTPPTPLSPAIDAQPRRQSQRMSQRLEATRQHIRKHEAERRAAKKAAKERADEEARAVLRSLAPPPIAHV